MTTDPELAGHPIEAAWRGYQEIELRGATTLQTVQQRRAFYAGATLLHQLICTVQPGPVTPDEIKLLHGIQSDLALFRREQELIERMR